MHEAKSNIADRRSKIAVLHSPSSLVTSRALFIIIAFLTVVQSSFSTALEVPPLRGRVNDYAGMLPPERARSLEEKLARFEQETTHQVVVLTIASLAGDSLEDFSIRVAEAWKIGQKGYDNGAILFVARDDRKLRIEVGYGLEGVLPDAIASRIIREIIVPRFRDGGYAGGIEEGVNAILKVAQGEQLPEDGRRRKSPSRADDVFGPLVFLLIFLPAIIMRRVVVPRSRSHGVLVGGAVGAGVGGIISVLSMLAGIRYGFGTLALVLLAAIALGVLGGLQGNLRSSRVLRTRRSVGWGDPFYADPEDFRGGRWGGGFGGGGFGGSSGGGFSGGGGGFGGGGASGSW